MNPKVGQVVLTQVIRFNELGVYVSLPEYNNIEGYVIRSELSNRRIVTINKFVRIGHKKLAKVLRVDDKYIDLTFRVTIEEKEAFLK